MITQQNEKAAIFKQLHYNQKMLLLPNIWDTITARLIARQGFTAIATASIAVAAVNGYHDGEQMSFYKLIKVVTDITHAVSLPVTVDFERGYSNNLSALKDNIKQLLDAGVSGINIEDGKAENAGLTLYMIIVRKSKLLKTQRGKQALICL